MSPASHLPLSRIAAAAVALLTLGAPGAQAATVSWIADANGFWDIGGNWSPGLPTSVDDVRVDVSGARVVTLRSNGGPVAINSLSVLGDDALTISAGSLTIAGLPTVFNPDGSSWLARLTHTGGLLGGDGTVTVGGAAALNGNALHTGAGTTVLQGASAVSGFNLDAGRTLRNEGTVTLTGGMNLNATSAAGTGRIVNEAGALFDVRTFNLSIVASNHAGDSGAAAAIANAGTFRKSTTGGYGVAVSFANLAGGVIDLQAGSFSFSAGGSQAGTVTLASGTTLSLGGGTHAVESGARFEGTGTLALAGAATVLDLLAPTTVDSAFSMSGGTVRGGDLTLNGPATLAISSSVGLMSGAATTTLAAASTVGGGGNNPFALDAGRVLRNEGSMRITGVIDLNRTAAAGAGTISNASGALIDVVTFNQSIVASSFAGDTGADASLRNAGTLRKSGSGTYGIAVPVVNLAGGRVEVQGGGFSFSAGGTHQGDVALSTGTSLNLNGGTHHVDTGARFTGAGTLTLAGAGTVLNLLDDSRVDTGFTMTGGTVQGASLDLAGPYALTISSSLGVFRGPGTTRLLGSGTVSGGANNTFGLDSGHVLRNEGTMVITGVLDLNRLSSTGSGRIANAEGALIDVRTFNQSTHATNWSATNPLDSGADARIDNAGTFRKSTTGTYSVLVPFFNTGTVEVLAGAFYMPTFSNGGVLDVAAGSSFTVSSAGFVNHGVIRGNGTLAASGGTVVNAGALEPGHSPGHLTIDGDLQSEADGVVRIELIGLTDFDRLDVTGDAWLAGGLEVVRLEGYVPEVGDSFAVIGFADRHDTRFDSVQFLGFGSGVQWTVSYRDRDLLIGVAAVPEPSNLAMLLAGLGVLGLRWRRQAGLSMRSAR